MKIYSNFLIKRGDNMKKSEAQALASEKSKLIIEYIIQILSDSERVNSNMSFCNTKIDNQPLLIAFSKFSKSSLVFISQYLSLYLIIPSG